MQLQKDLETLLIEIVQNQLVAGHFDVVPAVLKFQNSLPNFVMPNLANTCGLVSAMAAAMSKEEHDALLAKHLPIAMPGHYAQFEQLVQRWLVGSIPQIIYVDKNTVYNAEQHVNLCKIVYSLEQAINAPRPLLDAVEDAKWKSVAWKNLAQSTYAKQVAEDKRKEQRELEIAAAKK